MTRVTTDVDVLNDLFASGLVTIIGDLLMLSFVIAHDVPAQPRHDLLMLARDAVGRTGDHTFPAHRLAELPAHPRGDRQNQRVPAGARRRHRGAATVQSRRAKQEEFEDINRDHMEAFKDAITAYGWFYPVVEFLACWRLRLLLAYGGFRIRAGRAHARRAGGVFPVRPAVLPADSGSERKIQHPAIRDGRIRAHFQAAGYAAGSRLAAAAAFPSRKDRSSIEFDHVWFAYKDEDWVLRDVSFRDRSRAKPSRSWATPARAKPRSPTFCCGSTTFSRARSGSAASISANSICGICGSSFGVVLQDPYLFTGTLASNIRLGTAAHHATTKLRSAPSR